MDYLAALIGLVFVTILFNFSYPQNALDLLLRAREQLERIHQEPADPEEAEEFLRRVQGWFYFTDFLQFVAAYFVGFFVSAFTVFHLVAQLQSEVARCVAVGGVTTLIVAYIFLWYRSIGRVRHHAGDGAYTDRTEWLLGSRVEGVFRSRFPRRAFLGLFLATIGALVLVAVVGSSFAGHQSGEWARQITLGAGILTVIAIYLVNFWGLFLYMPYSSVAELQNRALRLRDGSSPRF